MYDQFYGLTGRPFQLTPDARFYYESGSHREALSYLAYGLQQQEGFIVITGEIGSGKSTIVAYLMDSIDRNRLHAVQLVSTKLEGDDLLRMVANKFDLPSEGVSKAELIQSIEQNFQALARQGKRCLVVVDEAQNLSEDALEELRMLSNFQLGGHPLLQIFLLGQPEFRNFVEFAPGLEQLRQRVIASHHLTAMEPEEIEPYIIHRLSKVGWTGDPRFTADAYAAMYEYSGGIPRKLNVLASRVLLMGALEALHEFNGDDIRAVIADMVGDTGDHEDPLDLELDMAPIDDGVSSLLPRKQKRSGGPVLAAALSPADYTVAEEDEYDEEDTAYEQAGHDAAAYAEAEDDGSTEDEGAVYGEHGFGGGDDADNADALADIGAAASYAGFAKQPVNMAYADETAYAEDPATVAHSTTAEEVRAHGGYAVPDQADYAHAPVAPANDVVDASESIFEPQPQSASASFGDDGENLDPQANAADYATPEHAAPDYDAGGYGAPDYASRGAVAAEEAVVHDDAQPVEAAADAPMMHDLEAAEPLIDAAPTHEAFYTHDLQAELAPDAPGADDRAEEVSPQEPGADDAAADNAAAEQAPAPQAFEEPQAFAALQPAISEPAVSEAAVSDAVAAEPAADESGSEPGITREMFEQQLLYMDAMAREIVELQKQVAEQDQSLRSVLTMLVKWVEADEPRSNIAA